MIKELVSHLEAQQEPMKQAIIELVRIPAIATCISQAQAPILAQVCPLQWSLGACLLNGFWMTFSLNRENSGV